MATKKQNILEKGFEVMYAQGYHGTSVQDIVTAANIPKGSFYHYFRTKEQFVYEALAHYTNLVDQEMKAAFADTAVSPIQRILNLYAVRIKLYEAHSYTLGCFAGNLTQEVADTNESMREALDNFFVHNRQPLEICLQEAQDTGLLSASYDIRDLAEYIVNSYEGALLRMKSTKDGTPLQIFQTMLSHILV